LPPLFGCLHIELTLLLSAPNQKMQNAREKIKQKRASIINENKDLVIPAACYTPQYFPALFGSQQQGH
jgi:hypothetical protein